MVFISTTFHLKYTDYVTCNYITLTLQLCFQVEITLSDLLSLFLFYKDDDDIFWKGRCQSLKSSYKKYS